MDINIVNAILGLCIEQKTCHLEIPRLSTYCFEQQLCSNAKYVLASIKNYLEIFKISRDQTEIDFFMPFEICRNPLGAGRCQSMHQPCSNVHLCYDYFYTDTCRRANNCPYPHVLTRKLDENILGPLLSLDLEVLSKAFRVYCQSKVHREYSLSQRSSSQQQRTELSTSADNNHTPSSTVSNSGRVTTIPQINGNASWKISRQPAITPRTLPKQQPLPQAPDKGLQIRWEQQENIHTHFIEVVFSNANKSDGGPLHSHQIYEHLGIAQVFYQNPEIADRVVLHGPVTFQSLTFTSRLLQRTSDKRHVCFANLPSTTERIASYIDAVSSPYRKKDFQYYQNDQHLVVVEYDEDIDLFKILDNVRCHPECDGSMIQCIPLYQPETLLIEHDRDYPEDDMRKLFDPKEIFHIKTYPYCSFVHFYSAEDLQQSLKTKLNESIRLTPIYTNIYSLTHLIDYLQRRHMEPHISPKSTLPSSTRKNITKESTLSPSKQKSSQATVIPASSTIVADEDISDNDVDEAMESDDDFRDLPSDFDDDDLFLDEAADSNGDMEFLRSAAKNLMSSLAEMEAASSEVNTIDAPNSLLYGDDYTVTIKSRRFALAYLDYTQFRVDKQSNPDKFRLLASLRKRSNNKKQLEHAQQQLRPSSPTSAPVTKSHKKRNKRTKK